MRSKAAKTVLWVLLGLTSATVLCMLIVLIIDMCGGTGTTHHWFWDIFPTLFAIFGLLLVLAYMLTEPSFKKKPEDEEELYTVDRTSYVKKAKQPRPIAQNAPVAEEATPAEEAAPAEEAKDAE